MRTIGYLNCELLTTLGTPVFNSALGSSEAMGNFDNAKVRLICDLFAAVLISKRTLELKSG